MKQKKSEVIRNTIDGKLWNRLRNTDIRIRNDDQPLKMIYMGTKTHDGDFKVILPALERLGRDFPGEFSLDIVGVASGMDKYPWLNELHPKNGLYPLFTKWYNTLEPYDIGLSPLEDSEFNSNKSDIKCLDYMGIGVKPVVSDTVAYGNPELDNFVRRVKNTKEQWYSVLRDELVNRKKYRKQANSKISSSYKYISEDRSSVKAGDHIRNRLKHYSVI